jgi:hypothetical protein
MPSPVVDAILELADDAGPAGIAMGTIVDTLERGGFVPEQVETEIWELLGRRRLTPTGFVCRTIKRKGLEGEVLRTRLYEFMLVPWSSALDRQLELELENRT